MKLGGGGGKAYMKLKRYERGVFDCFSRRGSALYEADRRGGEQYFEPENDVPYRICSVSIARSLTKLLYWVIPEVITFFLLAILFTWNQLIGQLNFAKLSWTIKSLGGILR